MKAKDAPYRWDFRKKLDGGRWHKGMTTYVNAIHYDAATRTGRVYQPRGACCDMSGCIAAFEVIDPGIKRIYTFMGDQEDTSYYRLESGDWTAMVPNDRAPSQEAKE